MSCILKKSNSHNYTQKKTKERGLGFWQLQGLIEIERAQV
jgi:hypothetical protein